jgi:hypothetical protein
MMEGYDHDDIYLMVEDEFHSIAQTFTQHLHHAEYQRLKKKARDAAPPSFQPTERMSAETRKKLEARAMHAKQKDTVANLTSGCNLSEVEEEQDDPWLGTSLAGLMTDTSAQKRTALVGLENIQSDTRAARGFGRGVGDSPAGRKQKMSVFDVFARPEVGEGSVVEEQGHVSRVNRLGQPLGAKASASKLKRHENPPGHKPGMSDNSALKAPGSLTAIEAAPSIRHATNPSSDTRSRQSSVAARRLFENSDTFDKLERRAHTTRKAVPPRTRRDSKPMEAKEKKMQMYDIPTFLV